MNKHASLISLTRRTLLAAAMAFVGLSGPAHAAGNPLAYVGEQHNIYLDCLRQTDPFGQKDPFVILVDVCGFDAGLSGAELSKEYSPLVPQNLLASLDEILKPYRSEFSDTQYAFISETQRILSTQSPKEAAVSLDALESKAVKTLGRENADQAVLAGLATARSSLTYWTNPGTPQPAMAKWWQVVLGDVAGGIVGGIFGAGVGAVGLGTACSAAVANMKD